MDRKNMSNNRLFFVDNLRILLTVLVILFHLAITYGSPIGDWPYKEGVPGNIDTFFFTTFVAVNQAFFMGFFFLISGYFTPGSFERKGAGAYLRDRLLRLGIPLVFYITFIDPVISYVLALSKGFSGSFMNFLIGFLGSYEGLGSGPLWFLESLLIFAFGYVIIRQLWRSQNIKSKVPSNSAIAFFALLLGLVTFALRIWIPLGYNFKPLNLQIPFFPQYIALYAIGILAYRGDWLKKISYKVVKLWSEIAVVLILILPVLLVVGAPDGDPTRFAGGLSWQSFALAIWEQLTCSAIIVSLTIFFRKRYNTQGRIAKVMSDSAYTVYIIHAPVIILLALSLRRLQLPLMLKWVFVSGLAVPLCFMFSYFIKGLPIVKKIL